MVTAAAAWSACRRVAAALAPGRDSATRTVSAASFSASSATAMAMACGAWAAAVKVKVPLVAPVKSAAAAGLAAAPAATVQSTVTGAAGGAPFKAMLKRAMPPSSTLAATGVMAMVRACCRYLTLTTAWPCPAARPPRASLLSAPKATVRTPAVAARASERPVCRRMTPLVWPAGMTMRPPVTSVKAGGRSPPAVTVYGTVTSPAEARSKFTANCTAMPSSTCMRRLAGAKVAVMGSSSVMVTVRAYSST